MPRLFTFLMGMVAGALFYMGASNYHVVRAQDGFHVVHKVRAGLRETYVDVRTFSVNDWSNHTDLVTALTQENKLHVMDGSVSNSVQAGMDQFLPNWN